MNNSCNLIILIHCFVIVLSHSSNNADRIRIQYVLQYKIDVEQDTTRHVISRPRSQINVPTSYVAQ